jgi:IS30 family transposase
MILNPHYHDELMNIARDSRGLLQGILGDRVFTIQDPVERCNAAIQQAAANLQAHNQAIERGQQTSSLIDALGPTLPRQHQAGQSATGHQQPTAQATPQPYAGGTVEPQQAGGRATGKLSADENRIIAEGYASRRPATEIARDIRRAPRTVQNAIKRLKEEQAGGRETGKLTADEKRMIAEGYASRQGATEIARGIRRAPQTVHHEINRLNEEQAGGRATGKLTADEKRIIAEGYATRRGATEIARDIRRVPQTVRVEIDRLRDEQAGGRETGKLTADEKRIIAERCASHQGAIEIARDIRRPRRTVQDEIDRLTEEQAGEPSSASSGASPSGAGSASSVGYGAVNPASAPAATMSAGGPSALSAAPVVTLESLALNAVLAEYPVHLINDAQQLLESNINHYRATNPEWSEDMLFRTVLDGLSRHRDVSDINKQIFGILLNNLNRQ